MGDAVPEHEFRTVQGMVASICFQCDTSVLAIDCMRQQSAKCNTWCASRLTSVTRRSHHARQSHLVACSYLSLVLQAHVHVLTHFRSLFIRCNILQVRHMVEACLNRDPTLRPTAAALMAGVEDIGQQSTAMATSSFSAIARSQHIAATRQRGLQVDRCDMTATNAMSLTASSQEMATATNDV